MEKKKFRDKRYCSVPGCKSSKWANSELTFHKPPQDPALKKAWWSLVNVQSPKNHMKFCSKHFRKEDFFYSNENTKKHILKKGVIPSQNLPIKVVTLKRKQTGEVFEKTVKLIKKDDLTEILKKEETTGNVKKKRIIYKGNLMDEEEIVKKVLPICTPLVSLRKQERTTIRVNQDSVPTIDQAIQVDELSLREFRFNRITEENLYSVTGISSFSLLYSLENCIRSQSNARNENTVLMPLKDCILLTFIKLKQNLTFPFLGSLFGITGEKCKDYFVRTLHDLSSVLSTVMKWPSKEEITQSLPKFFAPYKETRVILHCLNIVMEKCECSTCILSTYSFHMPRQTVKFMIGMTPLGSITFLSKAHSNRTSERQIFVKSKLLDKLIPTVDAIMIHKEISIDKLCSDELIKLIKLPSLKSKSHFPSKRKKNEVAAVRKHIKRAVQRIHSFSILNGPLDKEVFPYINIIMKIICGITNLSPPLINPQDLLHGI